MTDARKAEHEYRHNKVPRMPRLPAEKRQIPFTAWAVWIIFIVAAGAVIYSRF